MRIKYIILICLIISLGCRHKEQGVNKDEIVRVRTTAIEIKDISIPVHSTGTLSSSEELKLSFKTGGIIAGINVKEGQKVRQGTLLATLDMSEINANVKQAENGYDKARRDFTRAENLYRDSVATLEQKQNVSTALDVAESTLQIARFNQKHSAITAPSDGVILKQLARQNELVQAGYPVFLFGSTGKYWKIKSGLSDRDIVKVNQGDSAVVSFDAYPGREFSAVIDQVGGISDPYTGTYDVEMLLDGAGQRLASGFIANVEIYPSVRKTFSLVPLQSIVEADGKVGYVYVLEDSIVRKLRVNIEGLPGSMAAVSGLPGDVVEIVTEGASYLKDGMKVMVIK